MNTSDVGLFFGGWILVIMTMWAMSKLEGTKTTLYYLLWLGVALDLVTHGQEISDLFTKFGINPGPTNEGTLTPIIVNGQQLF